MLEEPSSPVPFGWEALGVEVRTARSDDVLRDHDPADVHRRLAPAERMRHGRFRSQAAARDFLAARALARELVAEVGRLEPGQVVLRQHCLRCGSEGHGPPRVDGPPISVSWSHSSGWVGVAASSSERVGLDLEVVGRISVTPALMQTALAPPEVDQVTEAVDPEVEFLRLWTQKEALVKLDSDLDTMARLPLADLASRVGAREWRSACVGRPAPGRLVVGVAVSTREVG